MTEQEARTKLQTLLAGYRNEDILFTETKFTDGGGFVDHHINWIKQHSDDQWDDDVALRRVSQLPDSLI